MLAIAYLLLVVLLGDTICRRCLKFASAPHRLAAALLTGLLISSWWTYLAALVFAGSASPLFWGNLIFFVSACTSIWLLRRTPVENEPDDAEGSTGFNKWDWGLISIFVLFTGWMSFRTFSMTGGTLQIGHHEFPDFSASLSIMQSFAEGVNFPTEHPLFAGERIRAYFLFYFQAGNLEYLGLNPALSNNILSSLSTTAMLALVMTLGRVLFNSAVAGRIGAVLFFFHGSLAFIPFLYSQASFSALIQKLSTMTAFLNSTLPHRGEDWGVWSQNVFLTQRNLTSSIGLLLIVLIYLISRYRRIDDDAGDSSAGSWTWSGPSSLIPYIFCGMVLGLMPMWNGAVLVQGLLLLGVLWAVFPLRRPMFVLFAVTAALAIPQLIYLQMGARPGAYTFFRWGYMLDNPSVLTVLYYVLFTFGFKWLLIGIGTYFTGSVQRRFLAASSSLLVLAFTTQLTEELLVNHKFFNIWLIIANVYVGYGLVKLWQMRILKTEIPARIAAVILAGLITIGGAIDLMPVYNGHYIDIKYVDDKLVQWLKSSTDPRSVFLSHRYMHHPILLTGRRLFMGTQYYAWEAGHDTAAREAIYRKMFESRDPAEVTRLLRENNIRYVAIDDTMRSGRDFIKQHNELLHQAHSKLVFEDTQNQYGNIKIYEVAR